MIFRHDKIWINDTLYMIDDLQNFPEKYRNETRKDEGASGTLNTTPKRDCDDQVPKSNPTVDLDAIKDKRRLFRDDEKIRVCKSGIIFSGSSAFPSNMYPASVTYKNKEYGSNEQAYQCDKAKTHDKMDLAKKLKSTTSAREIKSKAGEIVTTPEWNRQAPNKLEELFAQKMGEHPELLERLLDTYPLPLVEGTLDKRWGGGTF